MTSRPAKLEASPNDASNKLKHFRRIATRFDRRAIHLLGFTHIAAAAHWMR